MKSRGNILSALAALCFIAISNPPALSSEIVPIQLEVYDNLSNLSIDVDSGLGFNLAPDGDVRCNLLLNGPIENGDLDRLKAAIKPFMDRNSEKIPRLCLNSPGGSYAEGLAISQWLMAESIGTAVPANAICYSACSLMFMGGTYPWKGELNRFLHVTADVGFHAPYVTGLADEKYSNEFVAGAYTEGINAIRELMKLGVGNKVQRFPPELMAEMLEKGPNEVFSIDTVGKAIRFRVHLYGARDNPPIDKSTHCNACMNMNYGAQESYGNGGENDLCATDADVEVKPFPKGKRMISGAAPRGGSCAIDVETQGGKVASWMFVDEGAEWRDGLELAYWYLYSPSTPVKSLYDDKPDLSLAKADGSPMEFGSPGKQGKDGGAAGQEPDIADALVDFIKNGYLGHGKRNYVSDDAVFASEVEYYDKGRLPRSAVSQDHASYYKRWPERIYELIADSLQLTVVAENTVDASFRYAFQVASGAKKIGGIGITTLTIKLRDGHFEITRETGQVVSRN